jgi:molecular chaperone DnaK (HSP70)
MSGTARLRHRGTPYTVTVSREAFDAATADLVAQCIDAARRVIDTAKDLGSRDISRILLVGGSTRMPMIRTSLETQLGLPVLIHDPDKAVARGAAILASRLVQPGGITATSVGGSTTKRITPVLPKAIGIKTYSSGLPPRPDPYVMNVLPANTPLPVAAKKLTVATIVPDQSAARIELYEQAGPTLSEDLDANRLLYDGEVTGIPSAPAGSPIVLTINVEIDGRISVTAAYGTTGAALELEAFIHGVIDEQELSEQMANVSNLVMVM